MSISLRISRAFVLEIGKMNGWLDSFIFSWSVSSFSVGFVLSFSLFSSLISLFSVGFSVFCSVDVEDSHFSCSSSLTIWMA